MTDFTYIKNTDELARLCAALSQSSWVGIDTEFMREKTYHAKLCMIQLADDNHIACVDPLSIDDLSPLAEWLMAPEITKVLHAARQDIEVLYQTLNIMPQPLFDTQTAAAFCGYGEQIGYAELTAIIAGVELEKAYTRADWSRRPLNHDVLLYAADDVRYLGRLHDSLAESLDANNRRAWLDAEMAALADETLYTPDIDAVWLRVRGQSHLDSPEARGALQALATWREQRAMKKDRPRRWILPDTTLIELAQQRPDTPRKLDNINALGSLLKAGYADELLATIAAGCDHPIPRSTNATPTPEERELSRKLRKRVRDYAEQLGISPSLLANRKQLDKLALGERDLPVLSGWRREVIGEQLLAAIAE